MTVSQTQVWTPKPHQYEAIDAVMSCTSRGGTVIMATGTGKTVTIAEIIKRKYEPGFKILVIQDTIMLCLQNLKAIAVQSEMKTTLLQGKNKNIEGPIVVASINTITNPRVMATLTDFNLIIVDEAHHSMADGFFRSLNQLCQQNPTAQFFGFTATPERPDGLTIHPLMNKYLYQYSIHQGIADGNLVGLRAISFHTVIEDEMLRLRADYGEINVDEARGILDDAFLNQIIVRKWLEHASDRQTVAYVQTLEEGRELLKAFLAAGVPTVMVGHIKKNNADRAALKAYASGEAKIIINCMKLTEGFDHPATACAILARRMTHETTFTQAAGRTLRLHLNKTDSLLLDFAAVTIRHPNIEGHRIEIEQEWIEAEDADPEFKEPTIPEPREAIDWVSDTKIYEANLAYKAGNYRLIKIDVDNVEVRSTAHDDLIAASPTGTLPQYGRKPEKIAEAPNVMCTSPTLLIGNNIKEYAAVAHNGTSWVSICGPERTSVTAVLHTSLPDAILAAEKHINTGGTGGLLQDGEEDWMSPRCPVSLRQERRLDELSTTTSTRPGSRYEATAYITYMTNVRHINAALAATATMAKPPVNKTKKTTTQSRTREENLDIRRRLRAAKEKVGRRPR